MWERWMKWNGVFKAASVSFWPLGGCKTRLQVQPTVTNSCLSHINRTQSSRIIPSGRVCVHVKKVSSSVLLSLVSNDSWETYLSLSPLDVLNCCFIRQSLKNKEKCIKILLKKKLENTSFTLPISKVDYCRSPAKYPPRSQNNEGE